MSETKQKPKKEPKEPKEPKETKSQRQKKTQGEPKEPKESKKSKEPKEKKLMKIIEPRISNWEVTSYLENISKIINLFEILEKDNTNTILDLEIKTQVRETFKSLLTEGLKPLNKQNKQNK